jgi:outer membrane protein TolC
MIVIEHGLAQDTLSLKLQDVLEATLKNNAEIALATMDEENAAAKYNQANAVFLPQINLRYAAMMTNNPLNAFGFKLQQQSVSASDFNPELLNSPSLTRNYATALEWNQPIINMDMIYQRKAAGQQIDLYAYKMERTREHLTFEARKAYGQLQLSRQATSVLVEALQTTNAIFESSKKRFEKGFLQRSDLLLVEVQIASTRTKLAEAKSNVRNASDYLSLLMGIKTRPIYSVDSLQDDSQNKVWATDVSENRADLKALKSYLTAQTLMINSVKLSRLPKLNAFVSYMFNDKSALGFGSNSYLAGAQFTWNIFNGTTIRYRMAEEKIEHSKIARQLSYQKEQSQLELDKVLRQLADIRFALQQHQAAVAQAAEALRILRNRFEQGLVSTTDLLQSHSALSEQKLLLSEAIFKYNTTQAFLEFLTSTSFNKY